VRAQADVERRLVGNGARSAECVEVLVCHLDQPPRDLDCRSRPPAVW
jgi:hypothetical protein